MDNSATANSCWLACRLVVERIWAWVSCMLTDILGTKRCRFVWGPGRAVASETDAKGACRVVLCRRKIVEIFLFFYLPGAGCWVSRSLVVEKEPPDGVEKVGC